MTKACPVLTPAERTYCEIQGKIEDAMMRKVYAALQEATAQAEAELQIVGLDAPPPSSGYFASVIHQHMFCTLCHADPNSFAGGKADVAIAIIRNSQNIAKHHWGADIEPHPKS